MAVAINATNEKRLKEIFGVTLKDYPSNSLAALMRQQVVFYQQEQVEVAKIIVIVISHQFGVICGFCLDLY